MTLADVTQKITEAPCPNSKLRASIRMAEALSPMRSMSDGVLQPFRFVALEDDDHRRLRTSLDHVAARSSLGMKSVAFSTF